MRSHAVRTVAIFAVLAVANCFRDDTGPKVRPGSFGFQPVFSAAALKVVDFDRVRIRLYRPGTTDPALDIIVNFPANADSIKIPLTVPLQSGATSEDFDLTLAMINAAGDTVFRGGPTRVTATISPGGNQAPSVPIIYVGAGANAAGVRFTTTPAAAFFGDTALFAAVAFDSSGNNLPGTPIVYSVNPLDSLVASVPDPAVGRVVARARRGTARVIAALLTGPSATATLRVQPRPSALAIVSGNGQNGTAGATLAQLLVVRVTAADGLGVANVSVAFAATAGGGSLFPTVATTDSGGNASAAWTLGVGANAATATVTGITPVTFTATGAAAGPAIELIFPGNLLAVESTQPLGVKLSQPAPAGGVTVTVTSDSTQYVTVASPGTVAFAQGDTLKTINITGQAIGVSLLHATATGYAAGLTAIGVTPNFILLGQGVTVVVGQTANVSIQLIPAAPTGGVTVTLESTDTTIVKVTTPTVTIAGGQTSGNATVQGRAAGLVAITATAPGYATGGTVVTATTSVTGAVASTTVTPRLDTVTALNATFQLSAQARDSAGNPVTGSYTWVSRTPSIATVGALGLVTGLTNGASWIVATEAGGTKDSALIVVQQRVASILVTPGTRNIHLTRNYTFTAKAVDGLGSQVPGVTAFTWSSTAPAVATVDTAGYVVGVGLGTAQIRATAGSITGVANVSVITAITRIAVVVDTVGAAKTDTFSLPSLGLARRYRAIAHDTLDALMTGLAFTWASTNGSVAIMNTTAGDTASVTSAANGITKVNATAQGFTSNPGASLTVSQVLASIELSPPASNPTATIGIGGRVGLVARGKDANSRYIPGGSFQFASASPGIATVDAATGLATGVANGTASITASSGTITSNALTVTVGGSVPLVISFGRDTVSVGRGSTASIPILLSTPTPTGAPLTVNLTATAFAHWNPASVVIAVGQTSINATLVGDSAGTTTVTATDGSGQGYATGAAVAKVTANMRLAAGSYAINATDIVSTQVLLSDPSPAGGTYVTFSYSAPGIALVSPDPAFIPAGQLAADIQIHGLAAGTTTITPSAIGVNGAASTFTAYAAVLTPSTTLIRLGQGQYEPNVYVYSPTNTNVAIPVGISSSDSNVVGVTPLATIPSGSYYAYFTTTAKTIGSATLTLSSAGWTSANTISVVSTTPRVEPCCGGNYNTTSPQTTVTVYSEDSVGSAHYRTNSLVVHLSSRDPTVMQVIDTVVTVNPGTYYTTGRLIPGGTGGATYIIATASGHQPDSALYTVVGPKLQFSWNQNYIGAGQYDPNVYIQTPNNVTAPLAISLANSNPTSVGVPSAVTIPTSSYYQYFNVVGNATGTAQLIGAATGYQADTAGYTVTSPRLLAGGSATLNNFGPGENVTVYTSDSLRTAHNRISPLAVSVVSTDPSVVTVDSSVVTVDSGTYYNSRAHLTPVGIGTAKIIFTASGHVTLDTLTITVQQPKIQFSFTSALLGRRQSFAAGGNGFYIQTPDNRTSPLSATITQKHNTVDTLTTTAPVIPASTYYKYLDAFALAYGTDTLIVSAAGYLPDTAFITVTTSKFISSNLPATTTTTNPPLGINVYTADSTGSAHYASDTVVVAAASSDPDVLQPVQPFFRILKNTYYTSTTVTVVGPGTASMTYSDSAVTGYLPVTTNTVTVTGPALAISNGTPMLGMRQTSGPSGAYVYAPNNVATPLVVNLASTDPRVVTVPASVTIPAGNYYAYFPITALDTVGTIQVQATATGYSAGTTNVQVTQPKFVISGATQLNTTSPPQAFTVYAADANGTAHYTSENVAVTLFSTASTVASIDSQLTGITIPAGAYYSSAAKWGPGALVGTSQLQASDARAAFYKYNEGTLNVAVVTPSISFSWSNTPLGIGQYIDGNVAVADYAVNPITVGLAHAGTARTSTLVGGLPASSVVIPAQIYYATIRVVGLSTGTDTLVMTATSPAHNPDSVYTVVGQGRVDPLGSWPSTLKAGDSVAVTLYARDPAQNGRYVLAATSFTLAPNANLQFVSGGANSVVITSATIPADQYFVTFYVKGVSAGTGSAVIGATSYQTYTTPDVTVTP
jgi:hypothetical protein